MKEPTVSVLMPAYNAEATISEAIASVIAQSYTDFELIIIDDGSTDNTAAIAKKWASDDPRIHIIHCHHRGVVESANESFKHAKGTYWTRLDSDDRMVSTRLEKQILFLRACDQPKSTIVGTQVEFFPREALGEGTIRYESWLNSIEDEEEHSRNFLIENSLAHPSIMAHRSVFEATGGYSHGPFPEDYDFMLKTRSNGIRFHTIPEVLTYWRQHEQRLTNTDPRYSFDAFRRAKSRHIKRMISDGILSPEQPIVVWGAGSYGKRFMRSLEEENIPVAYSVDIDPKKIGRSIRSGKVKVIAPESLLNINGVFIFLAVAAPGARGKIEAFLLNAGFRPVLDFLAVQ